MSQFTMFWQLLLALYLFSNSVNSENITVKNVINSEVEVKYHHIYSEFEGEFGKVYRKKISDTEQFSWKFKYDFDENHGIEPSVHALVETGTSTQTPVIFEVRHHQSQSWTLPVANGRDMIYQMNKTLCTPPENGAMKIEQFVEVIVSARSYFPVGFELVVNLRNTKIVRLNQNIVVSVSPISPTYFKLGPLTEIIRSPYARLDVNLIMKSGQKNEACFTVSIQQPSCPVNDHQNNVQYNGLSHTISITTTMTLTREDLMEERFLVFVMHKDYSYCNSSQDTWKDQLLQISSINDNSMKQHYQQLEFVIRENIYTSTYYAATIGVTIFILVVSLIFAITYFKWIQKHTSDNRERCCHGNDEEISDNSSSSYNLCFLLFHVKDHTSRQNRTLQSACTKSSEQISKSARRYLGTFWVVSLFYAFPVVQFVLLYQRVLNKTGNEDLCYFNFKCLHPLGDITAFNHVFSNIAYIMLGMLFLFIVYSRSLSRWWKGIEFENRGLFEHNGIYYAMGSALVMEGFMSSFYHVCPTRLNFQFDTSFMYITAMLCLVKIYQSRHPDSNASAMMAFLGMALVIFLGLLTAIYQVWWLWMVITILHVASSLMFSVHLYSWGDWRLKNDGDATDSPGKISIWQRCRALLKSLIFPFCPQVEPITGFLIGLNILNWAFAVVGHIIFYDSQDIASYLLMLFLLNLTIYWGMYVTLKLALAKEKIPWHSWIYFGLAVPFWIAGMVLFFKLTSTWGLSQAESRELNEDCSFLKFYDYHDVWHFLSAFGMFFMFMFFFTMDDGLMETERDRIKVF